MNTTTKDIYNCSKKNPFFLVPWHRDFLEEIDALTHAFSENYKNNLLYSKKIKHQSHTLNNFSTNKQNIILVFPHARPKRYLENRYKKLAKKTGKAHILPHIMTGTEFQKECLLHFERGKIPYQELSSLDRISYLHEAVVRVAKNLPKSSVLQRLLSCSAHVVDDITLNHNTPKENLPILNTKEERHLSMAKFFPWARSLDALFEECFTQLIELIDIPYAENDVNPFAAALLSQLRAIHKEYILLLQENNKHNKYLTSQLYRASTPAFTAYRTAQFVHAYNRHVLSNDEANTFSHSKNQLDLGIEKMSSQEKSSFFDNFIPDIFKNKIIIFAGFVHLSQAENILYHFFWEKGAFFVLHSDPKIYQEMSADSALNSSTKHESLVHYSCEHHVDWLKSWGASCTLLPSSSSVEFEQTQNIHFYSAYDAHSQIKALKDDLLHTLQNQYSRHNQEIKDFNKNTNETPSSLFLADDDVALLLPEPSLLMPLLHELPEKEVNISMGYPVSRTLFGQCMELLLCMQENKNNENSAYMWKDILSLLSHPYAHMLTPHLAPTTPNIQENQVNPQEIEANSAWRSILYYLENAIRTGNYFINIQEFLDTHLGDYDALGKHAKTKNVNTDKNLLFHELILREDLNNFTAQFFKNTLQAFENIQSLQDVAIVIENFISFLLEHGASLWQNFPLEAESITICVERILPNLRDNALSDELLPQEALFTIFREMLAAERIPFEADPLQGMQILGMLESRLLRFKNVFLLDMTEDNMPGTPKKDPLLPDSLRALLSLPNTHTKERIAAHTFYRLIAGAENVWLYWQEGVQSSDIQSAKSLRSRFVEECLWKEEQKAHTLLGENKSILRTAECVPHTSSKKQKKIISITHKIKGNLLEFLKQGISSTALNTYIHCPAKFFYTYLLKIGEIDEVNEGNDARLFGSWLHKIFYQTYQHCDNTGIFYHDDTNFSLLLDNFNKQLSLPNVSEFASDESFFMLKNVGKSHLKNYFKAMPYAIKPVALEQNYTCNFTLQYSGNTLHIPLKGICDRVDIRPLESLEATKNSSTKINQTLFDDKTSPHYIVDYKTGKKEKVNEKIWNENEFWERIENTIYTKKDNENPTILLKEIAKAIPNIQLPFYLYLYAQNFPSAMCNASWIFLGEEEPEVSLVNIAENNTLKKKKENKYTKPCQDLEDTNDNKLESWALLKLIKEKRMPSLLSFVLTHLLESTDFKPCEGKTCLYCSHKNYC